MFVRHSFIGIVAGQSPDHFTVIGITWNDSALARFIDRESIGSKQQTKIGFTPYTPVADNALFVKDWLYLGIKVNSGMVGASSKKNDHGNYRDDHE
jgi:hypothetical protein